MAAVSATSFGAPSPDPDAGDESARPAGQPGAPPPPQPAPGPPAPGSEPAAPEEDAAEQGVPPAQSSRAVASREHEVVNQIFGTWICCFSGTVCVMFPTALGIFGWALVEYIRYNHVDCDAPLKTWFLTYVTVYVTHNLGLAKCVAACFCGWPDAQNPRPTPLLLKLYNVSVPIFLFMWNCLGLYWVLSDGSGSENPPCREAAPGLYNAVKVKIIFNIFAICFFLVYLIGPMSVLIFAIRHGFLHSPHAAPKGTIDKVTTCVSKDDPAVLESAECSICMVGFQDSDLPIIKTNCNHIFHKDCLKNWLERFNRNCPLCRKDLAT